jgi:hypothetical protein
MKLQCPNPYNTLSANCGHSYKTGHSSSVIDKAKPKLPLSYVTVQFGCYEPTLNLVRPPPPPPPQDKR